MLKHQKKYVTKKQNWPLDNKNKTSVNKKNIVQVNIKLYTYVELNREDALKKKWQQITNQVRCAGKTTM